MYGNGIASHPELCNEFIYIFSFRYPIERIVSFIQMYTYLNRYKMNKLKIFPPWNKLKTKEHDQSNEWAERWKLDHFKDVFHRYLEKHEFDKKFKNDRASKMRLEGYMNNAVTRWIGYEWPKDSKMNHKIKFSRIMRKRKDGNAGVNAPIREMNGIRNDIHFYNAIQFLLQTDYVFSVSSLFESKENSKMIWNKLLKDICKHFGLSEDKYFRAWLHERDQTLNRKNLISYLSRKDIGTLHKYNYFDFKLYELSKYIAQSDLTFADIIGL